MTSSLTFGSPGWLWALLLLPVLAALFVWAERQAARRLATLIQLPRLRAQLTAGASVGRRRWRYALGLAGLAGLVLAMAEPRLGYETRDTHRRGLDLIVIVDVSKSMLATDLTPNRLTRAKLSVQDLIGQLSGDRLGLVAFAGSAFLETPLTVAYDAVLDSAAELDTDLIPRGGTNIGGAIDLALEAFGKAEAGNRAIVLLSDGEPTSDTEQADGIAAAGRAAAAGVKVFTIGLGTTDGSLIPLDRNGQDFVRDEDGKIVRTRLDEDNLRAVAKAGGGFYTRFTNGEATMRAVVGQGLSQLKAGEIDARTTRRPIERYQWPLGVGLFMLGLAGCVGERRKARAVSAVAVKNAPARRVPAAAVVAASAVMLAFSLSAARAEDASPAAPVSSGNALDLYQNGHYDEAYHAFEDMAKKNPDAGSLQFNAGASAYMGKQYEEALDAFGHALASDNPDLQAKSHYNFGNTLFRRGEEQKDREAKIKDWKNAIQHYNSTLDALKREGKENPLASNTAYNRDLVQKRLDEEEKKTPPPQQKQDQKKQDKQQKKDQQKQDQSQKQDQPQKEDQPQKQDQQDQQNQGQGQPSPDQQQQQQQQQNQPPQPQDQPDQKSSSSGKPSDQKSDANQPPKPEDGQSPEPRDKPPDPSSLPNQDQPRQRGDFQSQGSPTPNPQGSPTPGDQSPEEAKEEEGKMNPSQARALLDSLKGEDDRVMLNGTPDDRKRQDEPVKKDW